MTRAPVRRRSAMGFNRRQMEAERKAKADAEAVGRRAADAQVLADAERLIDRRLERTQSPANAPCCSRRRSAPRSRHGAISFPSIARPAAPRGTLICARSTDTATQRSLASSRRCHAARVGRMHRAAPPTPQRKKGANAKDASAHSVWRCVNSSDGVRISSATLTTMHQPICVDSIRLKLLVYLVQLGGLEPPTS